MAFCKKITMALTLLLSLNTAWSSSYDEDDGRLGQGSGSLMSRSFSLLTDKADQVKTHILAHPLESLALTTSLALPYLPVDAYFGEGAKELLSVTLVGAPLALRVLKDKTLSMGSKTFLLVGGLFVSNAVPTAAAAFSGAELWSLPGGSYLGSCHNTTVAPYTSTDPHVPPSCVLTTTCDSTHTAIGGTSNTLYFGREESFTLGNNNGTLVVQSIGGEGTHGTFPVSSSAPVDCHPLLGSFSQTCEVTSAPYVTTDTNLAGTPLCEMRTHCETLGGTHLSDVVHYAHQGVTTVVENCDGTPVLHLDSSYDHQCSGVPEGEIKAIATK